MGKGKRERVHSTSMPGFIGVDAAAFEDLDSSSLSIVILQPVLAVEDYRVIEEILP